MKIIDNQGRELLTPQGLLAPPGTNTYPSLGFLGGVQNGLFQFSPASVGIAAEGQVSAVIWDGFFAVNGSIAFAASGATIDIPNQDTFLVRGGSATLQIGRVVNTKIDQTFKAYDANVADAAGPNLTLGAGKGRGTGVGGSLVFQTAPAGATSGSTLGTAQTRMLIDSEGRVGVGTESPTELLHVNGPATVGTPTNGSHAATKAYVDIVASAYVDPMQRVLSSLLPNVGTTITPVSGYAYFVYLGRTTTEFVPKYVEFFNQSLGSSTPTAEVGFFSSPGPPNKGGLTLTKLVSTASVDSMVSPNPAGVKRNSSPFNVAVPAGTHLWAGIRTAYNVNQPVLSALCMDFGQGRVLYSTNPGPLTGTGPWSAGIIGTSVYLNTGIAPDLRAALD